MLSRAQNNNGQTVFGHTKFLFNKDISQVVYVWDMGDDEYEAVQVLFKLMMGESVTDEVEDHLSNANL